MQVIRHLQDGHAPKGTVLVLGNFACVHRGHRALLSDAKRIAVERQAPLAVMVFEPHPQEFFRPESEPLRVTSFHKRAEEFEALGVDLLVVLAFDAALAGMSAQDFVLDVLVAKLGVVHVVVGQDFRFGQKRAGDVTALSYMGDVEGFGVTAYRPVAADGAEKISSSAIRNALRAGRPEEAARLLGHWWSVDGHVAHGDARGRTIGFPTANLKLDGLFTPAFGVYAARVTLEDGCRCNAVANFGKRPTVGGETPLLEVHLFDFAGDLYGKRISVEFISYIRPEQKFSGLEALKAQIAKDCDAAGGILSRISSV